MYSIPRGNDGTKQENRGKTNNESIIVSRLTVLTVLTILTVFRVLMDLRVHIVFPDRRSSLLTILF